MGDWKEPLLVAAQYMAGALVALILHAVLFRVLAFLARRTPWRIDELIVEHLRPPTRLLAVLLALLLPYPALGTSAARPIEILRRIVSLGIVAAVTWIAIAVVSACAAAVKEAHRVDVSNNLEARRVRTQVDVLARTVCAFLFIVGTAVALMTFPRVRQLGTSMLASAGVAGLVVGLSARPVLENLIAGLQIAFTQPIRIDDVVVIGGEWGRIEEISGTYVVVRIWDERRLIVPFSKFIQEPFQNWTRTSARILGTVYLYTDYDVPVAEVRKELERVVHGSELWDQRVCVLQVTDTSERTVQLRALVSAADSGKAYDLRVLVRERLIEYLRREHPRSLPRSRVELAGGESTRPAAPEPEPA